MDNKNVYILRRYVSCKVFDLENIANKTITLSSPKTFNDPVDTYFYFSPDGFFPNVKKIMTKDIMDKIRIACFVNCKDTQMSNRKLTAYELLMWTHYADAHKGICFEYEIPKDQFDYLEPKDAYDKEIKLIHDVSYVSNFAVDYEDFLNKSVTEDITYNRLLNDIFFTKDEAFKYENEFRLLIYNSTENNHISLEFDFLKRIIFGYRCTNATKKLISCLNQQAYNSNLGLRYINDKFKEVDYAD